MNRLLLSLSLIVIGTPGAWAKPVHKQALALSMGPFLPASLNDCRLCHVPGDNSASEDKPRNAFGERLELARRELKQAGKPIDIPARFARIADEDADGDGVSNLLEILTGHFPADKADKPTSQELAGAAKSLEKYRRFLASYPWKPFEPVKRPEIPAATGEWSHNPIDAFISQGYREQELTPRPEADKRTLLRRVSFDLIGLPPTAEEVKAFLEDTSPGAYAKVVDRLLASPRYGERWGRHWMDVWRYSDWAGWLDGNQIRDSQPHIWLWRDWIIESINADKGYDRMILEMLAGDEIAPEDPQTLRATGYLVRNYKMLSREKWMTDSVDHTFLAFQGLTIGCARCHDHLYDPIKQSEYYQVRAVFEPHNVRIDKVPGQPDTKKDGLVRALDANLKAVTYLYERGDERTPDKSAAILPGIPKMLGVDFPAVKPVKVPGGETTGRRTALAGWLTDAKNPLTARVAVNHIWLRHFGQALVPSVFDFGKNGRRSTHPALLDWLAIELVEHKWSMKHIHRLMVTSRAYRIGSTPDATNAAIDNDNVYLWRMAPRRLEAEAVRDQVLFVGGKLDIAMGGPDLDHALGLSVFRRSVYFRHAHEKQMEYLKLFDTASVSECYQRKDSIIPQQALALANSELSAAMALVISKEISRTAGDDPTKFVGAAFERMIGRPPTSAETTECVAFLQPAAKPPEPKRPEPKPDRRAGLILVLLNHHEFLTVR